MRIAAIRASVIAVLAIPCAAQTDNKVVSFRRVLYMHGGPVRDTALFEAMREIGFDSISLSPAADPGEVELATRHGFGFYLDQAVGKGVLELRDSQWRRVRGAYLSHRDPARLVRPSCLSAEDVQIELRTKLAASLAQVADQPMWGVCLGDEASATRRANPLDLCTGPACVARYRAYLQQRYADLTTLNLAWGASHAEWSEVMPWTADRIRERELHSGVIPANLTPWSDHLEFREHVFATVVAELARQARNGAPAGLTGMQPPSAYGGYDYHRLMREQTFYETYDIGGARELSRSFARPDALEFATLSPREDGQPKEIVVARLFDMVAHGMAGVIVWSCGRVFGADSAEEATPFGGAMRRAFRAIEPVDDVFAGARVRYSPIWILESQASVRAHWMLDSIRDRATWPNRLTSHESSHSTSLAARASWLRLIQDVGFQPRFVAAPALAAALSGARPRLLVLPASIALDDDTVAAIRRFVRDGGHVVADHGPARYDQRLRRRDRPALDELFGVRRADGPTALPAVREGRGDPVLRLENGACVAESDLRGDVFEVASGGRQIHCEHAFGRGRGTYLNLAICEYAAARLDPARLAMCRDYRSRVRRVISDAGAEPPVVVRGRGLPPFVESIVLETSERRRLLAVRLNLLDSSAVFAEALGRGAIECELEFPFAVQVTDLLSRTERGIGRTFKCRLDPVRPLMLELKDAR